MGHSAVAASSGACSGPFNLASLMVALPATRLVGYLSSATTFVCNVMLGK